MTPRAIEEWEEPDEEGEYDDDDLDTIACPNCGAAVYEDAEQCPQCGEYLIRGSTSPLVGRGIIYRWLALAGIAAVIASILLFWAF